MPFTVKIYTADNETGFDLFEGQAALDWFAENKQSATRLIKPGNGYARMTRETRDSFSHSNRSPRQGTRDGRQHDECRAIEYLRQIHGETPRKIKWDGDLIRWFELSDGVQREIPHWNWNGHNMTVDDCAMQAELEAA